MEKKILTLIALIFFILPETNFALSVGFENLRINPNKTKIASYSFGNYAEIFCYEANETTTGNIQWTYQGQVKNSSIPILLTTNSQFEGEFADANGNLKITNTSSFPVVISCIFAF
jgi:hypothetical protein